MPAYLKLIRPLNCLMSLIAVFIGGLLILGLEALGFELLYLGMAAAFLITAAGNTINDYAHVEADKVNKPSRPLASGAISRGKALAFSLALFAIGILLSTLINFVTLGIALLNSFLLIAYPFSLKNKVLLGNIAVSYLVGSTFLFGGAAAGNIALPFLLFLLAFFTNLPREIVKDMEDIEGDKALLKSETKHSSLSRFDPSQTTVKHERAIIKIGQGSLILALLVSPLPFLLGILGNPYLNLLIPADFLFLLALASLSLASRKSPGSSLYSWTSRLIKAGMLFGLLAFIAGALL